MVDRAPARPADDRDKPRWFEYPIGAGGELTVGITRTLIPFAIGIGGVFLLCLAIGLVAEEDVTPSPLLNRTLDQIARYTMLPVMALAWVAGLITCVAATVGDVLVSKAVLRAKRHRGDRAKVPPPHQVFRLERDPGSWFIGWAVVHIAVFGLLVVIGFFVALADPEPDVFLLLGIITVVLAVFAGGAQYIRKVLRPAHRKRWSEIAQFWVGGEQVAWGRARRRAAGPATHGDGERRALIRAGTSLTFAGVGMLALSALVINLLLFITHPEAQRTPGGRAGPRADLPETVERFVDQVVVLFAVLIIAGLAAVLIGVLVEAIGHAQERRFLRTQLADPSAERPADALLQRYAERHTPRIAQAFAALGGAGLCLGWSGIGLGGAAEDFADVYAGATEVFADLQTAFLGLAAGGAGLLIIAFVINAVAGAAGRDLRNELNARWPVRPKVDTSDKDNKPARSLTRPVMGRPSKDSPHYRPEREPSRKTAR